MPTRLPAFLTLLAVLLPAQALAEVTLPSVIGDHMMLQRDAEVRIWGWAEPGEAVTVTFAGQEAQAQADADGHWSVMLDAMPASAEGRGLVIQGENRIELTDILVGEVWVASGQSNMEWNVHNSANPQEEIANADHPGIRMWTARRTVAGEPQRDVPGQWQVCSPQTVGGFSAVGYYFARELYQRLDVPVGILHSSWGGTPSEAWTSREKLEATDAAGPILERFDAGNGPAANHPHAPAGLFNGMIAPILPYTIQGAIWYQGESNASRAEQYASIFPAMIHDWREHWGQGEFPFLFVQLANFMAYDDQPTDTDWSHLRDAQLHTLRTVPHTGMATIIDIGEANDIHPRNKQDVGLRLALWALADTYGEDVVKSGPVYIGAVFDQVEGRDGITVGFRTYGSELALRDGETPSGFTIAGEDGQFVPALATHDPEGDPGAVFVWSPDVPNPRHVRYAWKNNPEDANLVNEEGLPASPFRTDDLPGPTDGRR
jgi:sialate O-acetylesterase